MQTTDVLLTKDFEMVHLAIRPLLLEGLAVIINMEKLSGKSRISNLGLGLYLCMQSKCFLGIFLPFFGRLQ
jgi:hypothetical protein